MAIGIKHFNMKLDLEHYLALPLRHLAQWVGMPYDEAFRNGHAAHIGWGGLIMLTLLSIWWPLFIIALAYPIYREWNDAKGWGWNRKSWADLFTFEIGNLLGFIIWITTR